MARTRRKRSPIKRAIGELRYWLGWAMRRVIWIAIIAGVIFILWQRDMLSLPVAMLDPTSNAAFERWVDDDPRRQEEYAAFEAFLNEQGVGEVVSAWQLARVDKDYANRCNLEVWRLPPRELWPNVVPALRLVRDHIVPAMGEVEVQSSYRSPELNVCAGGAARSRHISFEALDLYLVDKPDDLETFYWQLCEVQENAGPQSSMGLGAYYDASDPFYNPEGRFHIDAAGYRSWGRSYTSATSICPRY
ncbi:MAG: D-Ala-D-Ala carboxypeptidase family metallohydrolase [Pseudomonadota bacterium]